MQDLWPRFFDGSNSVALLPWLVLIVGPRRLGWLNAIVAAVPLALAAFYAAILVSQLGRGQGGFGSIAQVRALFASDPLLVAGWQHYLAFDLFVGTWAAKRFDQAGLHRLAQAPLLAIIFVAGPVGYLLSALVIWVLGRRAGGRMGGSA